MSRILLSVLAVVVAAVLATAPTLDGSFVYDDEYYVVRNEAVTGEAPLWSHPLGEPEQALWRPLTVATYRLQWDGSGRAGPLHRLDVALHALVSILVLGVSLRLGLDRVGATLAGFLFAVHPAHAEAVAWITGRAELLAAAFVLASWWLHVRGGAWSTAGSLTALGLGVLCKENALVAPALFFVADVALHRRPFPWKRLLLLGLLSVALFAARTAVLPSPTPAHGPFLEAPLTRRLVVATNVVGLAFRLLTWPAPLRVEYHRDEVDLLRGDLLGLVLGGALAVLLLWRRSRLAALGLVLVPVSLTSVLHLVPIGEPFAERFLYLPSAPFCMALGGLLGAWLRRDARGAGLGPSLLVAFGLLVTFTLQSRAATRVFHDDLTLWSHARSVVPRLATTRYNLGRFLYDEGRLSTEDHDRPGAAAELAASLALEPRHPWAGLAHHLLGQQALGLVGNEPPDPARAVRHLRAALGALPGLVDARIQLASVALQAPGLVSPEEARGHLRSLVAREDLESAQQAAVDELLIQLEGSGTSSEESTGTSSPDGS